MTGVSARDHALAAELANEAGRCLLDLRRTTGGPTTSAAAYDLRREGDRRSHELLARRLSDARPGDAVLSEEGRDDPARLRRERVWIVDPLDGTREFAEPGRTDWAVHVALVVEGEPLAGAVALPALGVTLSTGDPPPLAPWDGSIRVVVSRSRRPETILRAAERLGAELVTMGSAGAKTAAVVRGDAEVYAHTGGQYEWDSAAPVAVARAAGLHASRVDGSPLVYNRADPLLPDLVVCRPELAERVLAALDTG